MPFGPARASALLTGLALAACALEPAHDGADAARAPILEGTRELGEDAVVLVLNRSGGLCSGSLISDRVVLTAKHCAQESGDDAPYDPSLIVVGIGDSRRNLSRTYTVAAIEATPGIYLSPFGTVNETLIGTDIALLTLSERVEDVTPLPVSTDPIDGEVGSAVVAIGYGQTETGTTGVKFRRDTTIEAVRADGVIETARAACGGDSGSPLLLDGVVVGVLSFGPGNCVPNFGRDGYNRIDLSDLAQLIVRVVREAGGCLDDGGERCDGFDNDCDGDVDEGCLPLGAPCGSDAVCASVDCRTPPPGRASAGAICTQRCDALRPELGCPPGFYCANAGEGGCDGMCLEGVAPVAALPYGAPCDADVACGTRLCAPAPDGTRRCLDPCQDGAGLCFAGEACAPSSEGCGVCVGEEDAPAVRALGEPCRAADDCTTGACAPVDAADDGGVSVCTRACDATLDPCPGGFRCRDGQCFPGFPSVLGGPCVTNGDCDGGGVCATRDIERWCTFVCDDTVPCPEGFACTMADEGVSVCAPEVALLGQGCVEDADCATGLCGVDGRCASACDRFLPCGAGFECRRDVDGAGGVCMAVASADGSTGGGGGCAVGAATRGGAPGGPAGALATLVALAAALRRRRRR